MTANSRLNAHLFPGFPDASLANEAPALREKRAVGAFSRPQTAVFHAEWFGRRYADEGDAYVLGLERVLKSDRVRVVVGAQGVVRQHLLAQALPAGGAVKPLPRLAFRPGGRARAPAPARRRQRGQAWQAL